MKIVFSRHAKRQMKWRLITEEDVKEAICQADSVMETTQGRKNALKFSGGTYLKVTFKEEADIIVVITAIKKSK